jgi:hypothetical protein
MPLEPEDGAKALQLITSRYNAREWRKKIEKTLSLNPSGFKDDNQRKIFMYLKVGLQAYKSRRADAPSWIVGGYGTKEVIDRALFKPTVIDPEFTTEHVALLGKDPGEEVDTVWWDDMLVNWFEEPEEEGEDEDDEDEESSDDAETASKVDASTDSSDTGKSQKTIS